MAFQYLTNVGPQKALEDYLGELKKQGFFHKTQMVDVPSACDRITAAPVYAHICAPHYHASAMDGIALSAADTFGATETTPVTLASNRFTTVDTGDQIPAGCDAVIMVEDLVFLDDGSVRISSAAAPWQHIRQIGEDICAGEMILPSYARVSPAAIGAMIAGGVTEIEVVSRPLVGVIPTGDEIVPPTSDPQPGDILEFNSSIFSAMLAQWGADCQVYPICPDKFDVISDMLRRACDRCDIVLLNAGSSAGREDYSCQAIENLGRVLYHGVAMKPGKPAILGLCGEKPVIGVPGYPVSGIIVMEKFVKPLLDEWFCAVSAESEYIDASLSRSIVSGLKYQEHVRVRVGRVGDKYIASPLNRGAGVVSSFMKADGIVEVPQGLEGYESGAEVKVRLLRRKSELDRTLVVIGSHDPLLDELADMLHRADHSVSMSSSHVGSMGGIMAVRRGEAHAAGIHLLNESDGVYNEAAIKKYFPNGDVRLVECVGRSQGLMLQKGNPLGIRSVSDLTKSSMRYVNRQKGSGTRILIDYLCKRENIDTSLIYGYDREEFTHTSVAAQIASGSADAGMGIYSAAKLYDLDFLPICCEQYDLLIPGFAWDTPMVQQLLAVLKSSEFRARIEKMGGYTLSRPGTVRAMHT